MLLDTQNDMFILHKTVRSKIRRGEWVTEGIFDTEYKTLEEIKNLISNHEYLKRVKGTEGIVWRDTKEGTPKKIGFILRGRYKDFDYENGKRVNFTRTEEVWCEVFCKKRVLIY